MKSQSIRLSGVEIDHVVVLDSSAGGEIVDIFGVDVAFVANVDQFE